MGETHSHASVDKVLKLLGLLAGTRKYSKHELIENLEISARSFYRYIDSFKNAGFVINKHSEFYSFAKNSPNYKEISQLLHFSEEEAYILNEAIHSIEANTKARENLISKLSALYDSDRISAQFVSKENSSKIKPLIDAIQRKKQVMLVNYKSSRGADITNRLAEPFEFTHNYISLWCFEPESETNKLFKISRIQKVEITDTTWQHEKKHHSSPLDCFRIGGEKQTRVVLRLTLKACNLLTEEYPLAEKNISRITDNEYLFDTHVAAYDGIARFVMGLPGEIEILENTELKEFIEKKQKLSKII